MGLPRMREEQVAELESRNRQIVNGAAKKIPYYCKHTCIEQSLGCATGWMLDTILQARDLEETPEKYDESQIRGINREIGRIPLLLKKADECESEVRFGQAPKELELGYLQI